MKKILLLAAYILLIICVFFTASSCNRQTENTPPNNVTLTPPESKETTKIEDTDVITKIPQSSPIDEFEAVRLSEELWLEYGLENHEKGGETKNLASFFKREENLVYLTLFDDMFVYDKDTSISVACALFEFIYDNYGVHGLTELDKRSEYKNAFLSQIGSTLNYPNPIEYETFMAKMELKRDENYDYIITFGNTTYYFESFAKGYASSYHTFLYYNTIGLEKMIEYIKNQGLEEYFDTARHFNYYMTLDGSGISSTDYKTGDMTINSTYTALHESTHAMGLGTNYHNIWLCEGLADYFGDMLGFNGQIAENYINTLLLTKNGYYDLAALRGDENAVKYKEVLKKYLNSGGSLASIEDFDLILFNHANALYELEKGSFVTIGDIYKTLNGKELDAVGAELSYEQAASFVNILIERYGIQKVMEAYQSQNIENTLGKTYDNLKDEWLKYINDL